MAFKRVREAIRSRLSFPQAAAAVCEGALRWPSDHARPFDCMISDSCKMMPVVDISSAVNNGCCPCGLRFHGSSPGRKLTLPTNQGRNSRIPRSCSNVNVPKRSDDHHRVFPARSPICKVLSMLWTRGGHRRLGRRSDGQHNVPSSWTVMSYRVTWALSGRRWKRGKQPLPACANALKHSGNSNEIGFAGQRRC